MKLNWITLRVKDLEKSMEFYSQLLQLSVAQRFNSGKLQIVMLGENESPKIELIYDPDAIIENPGNGVSVGLSFEDLDAVIKVLRTHNVDVVGPISPNPHIEFYFVKDPDGYTIQLVR